ncbi:MAG: AMP-binding protein [Nocardiaceae bacterium]|nr:AMP-binding protein [Nocardiaceae bacterium]
MIGSVQRLMATAQNGLEVLRYGGLQVERSSSPSEVVVRKRMYDLRHYFPGEQSSGLPPVLLIPPLMVDATIYDVQRDVGAAGVLNRVGMDVWVVDFGKPNEVEGGLERTMADHVVAVSEAIDEVRHETGRDVHLGGYSQGGMFCYQAAAYRQSAGIKSIITFGSPVDLIAGLPFGLPAGVAVRGAEFMADHVFNRIAVPEWMVRAGFQMMDPVKTLKSRVDFVRQLHDRDALLPREAQRLFLQRDGWAAYAGPALAELLRQFIAHNRLMTGGFVIDDRTLTLADVTVPILAFVGEVDDIGQPPAVRGIKRAAPRAQVYEASLRAGHFGLVVGNTAAEQSWPITAQWIQWIEDQGPRPAEVHEMSYEDPDSADVASKLTRTAQAAVSMGAGLGMDIIDFATSAFRGTIQAGGEAARTLPKLSRLGLLKPQTPISLGLLLEEQGRRAPLGECFLFEDRVHTNAAVNTRIDNVVRGLVEVGVRPATRIGVLMETRPSALVTIAALSRLGAIAVLLPPGGNLAEAMELTGIDTIIADPDNLVAAVAVAPRVLVLGGGEARSLSVDDDANVIDLEKIDPSVVQLPGWYRPNPGQAQELAFILFGLTAGRLEAKYVTNYRWAVSAFGTASAADLSKTDTVYCLAPLHHSSGLLVSLGGAIAGGSRIALARGYDPERFVDEVYRYGVTVITYTWLMMRDPLQAGAVPLDRDHPVRLFIGSGMPPGLWERVSEAYAPARVLEFFASTEGDVVLANVAGLKAGCKGRPVPGTASVELVAFDPVGGRIIEDEGGFARRAEDGEIGLLLGVASQNVDLINSATMRGVLRQGDSWVSTETLFRRDADGDYWLVDGRRSVTLTPHGPVYSQPIVDALEVVRGVDFAVTYGVGRKDAKVSVAAIVLLPGAEITGYQIGGALSRLASGERPDIVHVVDGLPFGASARPLTTSLVAAGLPAPGKTAWSRSGDDYVPLTAAAVKFFSV